MGWGLFVTTRIFTSDEIVNQYSSYHDLHNLQQEDYYDYLDGKILHPYDVDFSPISKNKIAQGISGDFYKCPICFNKAYVFGKIEDNIYVDIKYGSCDDPNPASALTLFIMNKDTPIHTITNISPYHPKDCLPEMNDYFKWIYSPDDVENSKAKRRHVVFPIEKDLLREDSVVYTFVSNHLYRNENDILETYKNIAKQEYEKDIENI
jgi:hypothetical protein